jgi:hypothetical protein
VRVVLAVSEIVGQGENNVGRHSWQMPWEGQLRYGIAHEHSFARVDAARLDCRPGGCR